MIPRKYLLPAADVVDAHFSFGQGSQEEAPSEYVGSSVFICARDNFFPKGLLRMIRTCNNPQTIVAPSFFSGVCSEIKDGVALFDNSERSRPSFIAKVVDCHEFLVGMYATNALRDKIPNFPIMYAALPFFSHEDPPMHALRHKLASVRKREPTGWVCMQEYIENSRPISEATKEFPQLFSQAVSAILLAASELDYSHNDLHCENVIFTRHEPRKVPFFVGSETVETEVCATAYLIDSQMACASLSSAKDVWASRKRKGKILPESVKMTHDDCFLAQEADPLHDIVKLIVTSHYESEDRDTKRFLEQVWSLVSSEVGVDEMEEWDDLYYSVPLAGKYTMEDMARFAKSVFEIALGEKGCRSSRDL